MVRAAIVGARPLPTTISRWGDMVEMRPGSESQCKCVANHGGLLGKIRSGSRHQTKKGSAVPQDAFCEKSPEDPRG